MPSRRAAATSPATAGRRRTGIFHRESTRLRSNVADQVQRDLLPAGRMLSVFLILCELLAEVAVLVWSRGQKCDRPLRFWVQVLIALQAGTVFLNCLNIWQGRDSFGQHRNGLSATDIDMYTDAPAAPVSSTSPRAPPTNSPTHGASSSAPPHSEMETCPLETTVVMDVSARRNRNDALRSHGAIDSMDDLDTRPLLYSSADESQSSFSRNVMSPSAVVSAPASATAPGLASSQTEMTTLSTRGMSSDSPGGLSTVVGVSSNSDATGSMGRSPSASSSLGGGTGGGGYVSTEFVDRYVRIVNMCYLLWFILGSIWVSDGGTCSATAPHLYRLIVALTIIYYALLFLPLACFCLIVCCLPLFILVYRIMLPYAERERRRARAADPAQVQNLNSIVFSPETFQTHTGNDSLDDASCVICLCDYEPEEVVRFLPCKHHFHKECVDVWLRLDKACCLCKQDIDVQIAAPSVSTTV